jgi:hypothetical protein
MRAKFKTFMTTFFTKLIWRPKSGIEYGICNYIWTLMPIISPNTVTEKPHQSNDFLLSIRKGVGLRNKPRAEDPIWWLGYRRRLHKFHESKTLLRHWSHTWWK